MCALETFTIHLPRFLQFFCCMHNDYFLHNARSLIIAQESPFSIFGDCIGVSSSCPILLTPLEHTWQQMGGHICIIRNIWSLFIQYCPPQSSLLIDCCCNIAVYCCFPPGAGGVDPPKFIVAAVPLHGWGLSVCENYPCRYPRHPTRLSLSVDCRVVSFASLSDHEGMRYIQIAFSTQHRWEV